MADDNNNLIFSEEVLNEVEASTFSGRVKTGPVTVLGHTFANDEERRAFFREELRKKLPELKKIEGFPIGEDEDIIALSDPPYYTACPNPWAAIIIEGWEAKKEALKIKGKRVDSFNVNVPFADDIHEGKNNPIYNAHTYHTKVPHPAIMKLLAHYTQPGDIIYDGFAGSGMMGVAAGQMESVDGRRYAICSDLSPIASFIAYNYNNNCSSELKSFYLKLKELEKKYQYLYETNHTNGQKGIISYVVWSDLVLCPHCGRELKFWDLFVEYGKGNIKDESNCPRCGTSIKRNSIDRCYETYYDPRVGKSCERVRSVPVLISYKFAGKKYTKVPDSDDIKIANSITTVNNDSWYPTYDIGTGYNLDQPRRSHKVEHFHQFYNPRTLFILSKIWETCSLDSYFCITNGISRNLTKLNRFVVNKYNPYGRINGPLSGTLYIPSEEVEQNVFELLSEKRADISGMAYDNIIQVGDALHARTIPDNCVDYIFTDPPFGANIMYSEMNSLSESWLKVRTDNTDEAIENDHQNKGSNEYFSLMLDAFRDYYRILKPGKWMTVEFSNTKASVWNSIQTAIQGAGFVISSVSALDKKHGGIRSMTFSTSVKEDLIISCYKPLSEIERIVTDNSTGIGVWEFIEDYLQHVVPHKEIEGKTTGIVERSPKILYDRLITFYVQKGLAVPIDASDFQVGLRERFEECDGMFFTVSQLNEYLEKKKRAPEFVPMGLIVDNEADGIEWLRNRLRDNPQTYQQISPDWMQAINGLRKGDILPELMELLEENFIQNPDETWRLPNIQDDIDKEKLREKALLKEFKLYVEAASKPHARIKEARVEAIRCGFKKCYMDKDFATIVMVGDKIPQNLLTEDDILLQFYDIARTRV